MEMLFSAVLSEAITRSISFFIGKCTKLQGHEVEDRLRRVLLRAQVIINEAMARQITNQAMLQQLDMLRGAMQRGHYMLDTFRCQSQVEKDAKHQVLSSSFSHSKVNYLKDLCYSNRNTQILGEVQKALDNLSSMIVDMEEVVMFLASYRRLYRQPYSMHILLGNCMFGRQMETELAVKFLLHTQHEDHEELEVLPVVGPSKVGKSTFVAHVSKDERVCDYFSKVLWLRDHDFTDDEPAFREGCSTKLRNCVSNLNKEERLLVILELVGDLNEDVWNKLYSCSKQSMARGSKIIITSRSDKVVRFGTIQALTLMYLPQEAFWYLFKILAFGSMDPDIHVRHMQVAMEMAEIFDNSLNGVHVVSSLLRDNFDIHFWCKIRRFMRRLIQKNISKFGEHPSDLLRQNRFAQFGRMAIPSESFFGCLQYERSSQEEIPKITMKDVLFGTIALEKSDILLRTSQIPPYYSYVYTWSAMQEQKSIGAKRKRSMKNGLTNC